MTDAAEEWVGTGSDGHATVEQAALPAVPAALPSTVDERPELAVGAAFAGGLFLGLLLKRLGR